MQFIAAAAAAAAGLISLYLFICQCPLEGAEGDQQDWGTLSRQMLIVGLHLARAKPKKSLSKHNEELEGR
tara:strand:- start:295 stop:504 length:210 start_codon:yes stop_codon:yes gene_type:complete